MRPQKITFGDMREMGVRGVLVYCADYRCSHSVALSADRWPDEVRLSDIISACTPRRKRREAFAWFRLLNLFCFAVDL